MDREHPQVGDDDVRRLQLEHAKLGVAAERVSSMYCAKAQSTQ